MFNHRYVEGDTVKPKPWDVLIAGTTALFLALFFYSREYFVKHHLIPVSFAVLGALGMLRTHDAYKSGNASKLRLYGALVLAVVFIIIGIWMDLVDNRVLPT
ncbi:hypothetical protein JCM16307_23170 [Thermococcus prieurii]